LKKFYGSWISVGVVYIVTLILLVLGPVLGSNCPLWLAIVLFTVWDVVWALSAAPDRTAQETLESSTRARTYTSYFIAIYGAGLAYFLLRMGSNEQKEALTLIKNAGVSMPMLLVPLVLPAVALMFFPIRLGSEDCQKNGSQVNLSQRTPTSANLAILTMSAWTQKVATFCFIYEVARIGASLAQ
jgi:hypothetical protein